MQTVAVLDFETTGLSPNQGDRATEIAVILLRDGQIVDRFQSLMNAGRRIPSDVVNLTGITNDMIASAPSASKVMREVTQFVGTLDQCKCRVEMR
jgi:DNA polymerase-3 subunit epsilon